MAAFLVARGPHWAVRWGDWSCKERPEGYARATRALWAQGEMAAAGDKAAPNFPPARIDSLGPQNPNSHDKNALKLTQFSPWSAASVK